MFISYSLGVFYPPPSLRDTSASGGYVMAVLGSVVSFWEISLKYSIGRLDLGNVTPDNFPALVRQSGFDILPLADTDQKEDNSFGF